MLDSREFRIGNLLQDKKGNVCHIEELNKDNISAYSGTITYLPLEPITITEDWLIRFGFFIVNYNGIEATMPNKRYTIKSVKDYDGWFFCDGDTVLTNLEFIHTLQNLWFFMTTQELQLIN